MGHTLADMPLLTAMLITIVRWLQFFFFFVLLPLIPNVGYYCVNKARIGASCITSAPLLLCVYMFCPVLFLVGLLRGWHGTVYLLVTSTTIFNFITVNIKGLVKARCGSTHLSSQYFRDIGSTNKSSYRWDRQTNRYLRSQKNGGRESSRGLVQSKYGDHSLGLERWLSALWEDSSLIPSTNSHGNSQLQFPMLSSICDAITSTKVILLKT